MKKFLLTIIFLLAFILRIYKLDQFPLGLTWDEAALGYNAYSILKTGKDEYGKFLPLIFKSFGDYKPGLYVYLTVPSVALLGLNELAVRIPSAMAGTFLVIAMFLLIKQFFSWPQAALGAFLMAINPWLIHFSRGAWEANLALFETILGVYLFVKFAESKKFYQGFLASAVLGLTFLTYQGAKVFTSLIVFGLIIFWFKQLSGLRKKQKFLVGLPVFLLFIFINLGILTGRTSGRLKVMSIFSYRRPAGEIELIKNEGGPKEKWFFPVFHSEVLSFTKGILGRYFNHFSARFLFFEGDWSNKRHSVPYMGVMEVVSIPFLLLGLATLFAKKRNNLEKFFLYWLLIAPLPAAITRDSIQAIRSLPMAIPLIFITSTGIFAFFDWFGKRKVKLLPLAGLVIVYVFNLVYYLDLYYVHYPFNSAKDWLFGYRQAVKFVEENQKNYQKIIFTQKYGQPYIFWLFYTRYPPLNYQRQAFLKESPYGDVGEVERLDNIEFRKIYWPADRANKNSLFVGDEFDLPLHDIVGQQGITLLKEIKFLNGNTAFRIVETK